MNGWVTVLGITKKIHQRLHPAEIKVLWRQVLLVSQAEINETEEVVEGSLIVGIYAHDWDCNLGEDSMQEAMNFAISIASIFGNYSVRYDGYFQSDHE